MSSEDLGLRTVIALGFMAVSPFMVSNATAQEHKTARPLTTVTYPNIPNPAAAKCYGKNSHKQDCGDDRGHDSLTENFAKTAHFFCIKRPHAAPVDGAYSFFCKLL